MAVKTYEVGLRLILTQAHRYGTRYQARLAQFLTAPQYTCLVSTLQAIADCLAILGEQPIEP